MGEIDDNCKLIVGLRVVGYRCFRCGAVERLPTELKGWTSEVGSYGYIKLLCPKCSNK